MYLLDRYFQCLLEIHNSIQDCVEDMQHPVGGDDVGCDDLGLPDLQPRALPHHAHGLAAQAHQRGLPRREINPPPREPRHQVARHQLFHPALGSMKYRI